MREEAQAIMNWCVIETSTGTACHSRTGVCEPKEPGRCIRLPYRSRLDDTEEMG